MLICFFNHRSEKKFSWGNVIQQIKKESPYDDKNPLKNIKCLQNQMRFESRAIILELYVKEYHRGEWTDLLLATTLVRAKLVPTGLCLYS